MAFSDTSCYYRFELARLAFLMGETMAAKKYWRCKVCGDIHYGVNPPQECPTCHTEDAYEEISKAEAKKLLGL